MAKVYIDYQNYDSDTTVFCVLQDGPWIKPRRYRPGSRLVSSSHRFQPFTQVLPKSFQHPLGFLSFQAGIGLDRLLRKVCDVARIEWVKNPAWIQHTKSYGENHILNVYVRECAS